MELFHKRILHKGEDGLCSIEYKDENGIDTKAMCLCPWEAEAISNEIKRDYMVRPRDNDGVPYHKGDKVWSIDSDTECSAVVTNVSESSIEIKWEGDTCCYWGDPCDMTHKRPESINAIIDDMRSARTNYCVKRDPMYDEVSNWISRLENLRDSGHC